MKTFTIDKAYNCLYWQTAVVRAENIEQAIDLAIGAESLRTIDNASVALDSAEAGIVALDEWTCDGGWGECGPTFITDVALGAERAADLPGRAFNVDDGNAVMPVPKQYGQFATEWPQEAAELERLREQNLRLRGLAQLTLDDIEAFDAQCYAEDYTDTEEAWIIMGKLAALARKLLADPQPAKVPA
jgi:hypothetical protein